MSITRASAIANFNYLYDLHISATSIVNEDLDDDEFMPRDEERNLYPELLNDPLTNGDFENSISTALSGYDVVIGAPINVIQSMYIPLGSFVNYD